MPTPIFAVYDSTDTTAESNHSFGQVKASTTSAVYEVHAWNNKGQSSAVSDIIEATVTTTDSTGNFTGDVVTNKWIEVNVNNELESGSTTDLHFDKIGGLTKAAIRGMSYDKKTDANGGGTISGAANDGNAATAATKANFAICKFRVNLPMNAPSGQQTGKIRFEGYYV